MSMMCEQTQYDTYPTVLLATDVTTQYDTNPTVLLTTDLYYSTLLRRIKIKIIFLNN